MRINEIPVASFYLIDSTLPISRGFISPNRVFLGVVSTPHVFIDSLSPIYIPNIPESDNLTLI